MKTINITTGFLLLVNMLLLAACAENYKLENYTMPDGTEVKSQLLHAPNGKKYAVVRIDSVSIADALNLQRNGWVLPRCLGVYATDEHRYTSIPTIEMLLGIDTFDLDADMDTTNRKYDYPFQTLGDNPFLALIRQSNELCPNLITSTRTIYGKLPTNYILPVNQSVGHGSYRLASFDNIGTAFLFKDLELVNKEVPDSCYLTLDGNTVYGSTRIIGGDGYDYYVADFPDTTVTWKQAIAMEKDGWLLPRSEGETYGISSRHEYWNRILRRTRHTGGPEPTIEGITGRHNFSNEHDFSTEQYHIFPSRYWLGTPLGKGEALDFYLRHFGSGLGQIGANVKDAEEYGAKLVKRIIPEEEYPLYDGIHPYRIIGESGKAYYIVDPSGWKDFTYMFNEVRAYEKDGWRIPTSDEMADMLRIEGNVEQRVDGVDSPYFYNIFQKNREYFMARRDGTYCLFKPYYDTPYWGRPDIPRKKGTTIRNISQVPGYEYGKLRLIKTNQ